MVSFKELYHLISLYFLDKKKWSSREKLQHKERWLLILLGGHLTLTSHDKLIEVLGLLFQQFVIDSVIEQLSQSMKCLG